MPLYSFFFFFFFFPGEGGVGVSSGMSGSNLPQRHYCLGRMDICCLLSHVCEWETSACGEWREPLIRFHFWSFWKVFLFFIARVFTVQIVFTKTQTDDLIFQVQTFVIVHRGGRRRARARDSAADWKHVLSLPWDCGLGAVEAFHPHGATERLAFCFFLFFFVTLETRHRRLDWPCRVQRHYSGSIERCKIHSKALP